jgi:ElaB/YqjD/DUF883 family membrane-anchored ribosome-binding protein
MANTSNPGSFSRGEHTGRPGEGQQKTGQTIQSATQQAKEAAGSVTGLAQDATRRAGEMAANAGQRAGEAVSALGEQMENLAETIRENAPQQVHTAASAVADRLEAGGRYLQEQDLSHMVEDFETIVRRYPLQSVLIGLGLGFFLARAFRR